MKDWKQKYAVVGFVALLMVLCTLLGVLFTQGRYEEEVGSGSQFYDGEMDFTVSREVEVSTVEELLAAIENGYPNIKIADSVDNPLIITTGVADVGSDLILDLNGHEIQRNNREPMLNIENGVRLTIIDTSVNQEGSFYNPVGSVLQIDGGTLTVSQGAFISGPKSSEYAESSGSSWTAVPADDDKDDYGGTIGASAEALTLYEKVGDSYTPREGVTLPIVAPYVKSMTYTEGGGTYWFVNGNMYFDKSSSVSLYDGAVLPDTYLYYVLDDEEVSGTTTLAPEGAADFYYTYNVERKIVDGKPSYTTYTTAEADGESVFTVTVYGYHSVKAEAEAEKANNFATVRMLSGNMYARGGSYDTNFGTGGSYGVYAEGGYMAVQAGTFNAVEGGTCIECNYEADTDTSVEYLRVSGGSFVSENGDTVRMNAGRMVVTGGGFTKNDTDTASPTEGEAPAAGEKGYLGAAIRMQGGELLATGTGAAISFTLTGSTQYGVYAAGGSLELTNANFIFTKGSNNRGVYAQGAQKAELTDTNIRMNATVDSDGKIAAEDTTAAGNYGVLAAQGSVTLRGSCTVDVAGASSGGLLASGGSVTYEGGANNALQVRVDLPENTEKQLTTVAVAALSGNIDLTGTVNVASNGLGVAVYGGETTGSDGVTTGGGEANEVRLRSGQLTINTTRATALYVSGGNAVFGKDDEGNPSAEEATVSITSAIDEAYKLSNGNTMYHGVFVQGGSLDAANATFKVEHTGVENSTSGGYASQLIRSFAVNVEGSTEENVAESTVTISRGEIRNSKGGGVHVSDGDVFLGVEKSTDNTALTIETTGKTMEVNESGEEIWKADTGNTEGNWSYRLSTDGGNAVEVQGGLLQAYSGTYRSAQGNGILVRGGDARLYGGEFEGNDTYKYTYVYEDGSTEESPIAGPGASYAFKLYGGTVTTYGGTFGGSGSSAFVMGTTTTQALAKIYGGTFAVEGQAGFSVYTNVNITFEEGVSDEYGTGSTINVSAGSVAIAVEKSTDANTDVTIRSGTFESTLKDGGSRDAIWYSNPYADLTIHGGTFTGSDRAALYVENYTVNDSPQGDGGNHIQIHGGTFTGAEDGIWCGNVNVGVVIDGKASVTGNGGAGLRLSGGGKFTVSGTPTVTGSEYGIYFGTNNARLSVSGGTFTGNSRSGLYFEVEPEAVQLSGGTFVGFTPSKESGTGLFWTEVYCYHNGAISCTGEITGIYLSQRYDGLEINYNDIVASGKTVYYGNNKTEAENKTSSFSSGTVHEMFAQYVAICIA